MQVVDQNPSLPRLGVSSFYFLYWPCLYIHLVTYYLVTCSEPTQPCEFFKGMHTNQAANSYCTYIFESYDHWKYLKFRLFSTVIFLLFINKCNVNTTYINMYLAASTSFFRTCFCIHICKLLFCVQNDDYWLISWSDKQLLLRNFSQLELCFKYVPNLQCFLLLWLTIHPISGWILHLMPTLSSTIYIL